MSNPIEPPSFFSLSHLAFVPPPESNCSVPVHPHPGTPAPSLSFFSLSSLSFTPLPGSHATAAGVHRQLDDVSPRAPLAPPAAVHATRGSSPVAAAPALISSTSWSRMPTCPAPNEAVTGHFDERMSSALPNTDAREALLDVRRAAALSLPHKSARRPAAGNELAPSIYRPPVPADRRVLLWTSPHSLAIHLRLVNADIGPALQGRIYEALLRATTQQTREAYGAGLLRFHQFCDRERISEQARLPADRLLLAAFIAEALGTCSGKCIRNWLNGLRLWHLFNDADWHGDKGWLPSLKKAGDRAGVPFKRPPRGPITKAHMRAVRASLDLSTGFGAACWATATSAFWGCCRLGELLIRSMKAFSTERDTCRSTRVSRCVVNRRKIVNYHIVWTKTTTILGGECVLTETGGDDADLCPEWAWENHMRINHTPPPLTPLFAYRDHDAWRPLTKDHFLRTTSAIFKAARLETVFGHSYRIGGSVELLLAGVDPEVIMKLGGWTSLCFLIYWRRLEQILPSRITSAWDARIKQFASAHGHPYDSSSLAFDDD